MHRGAIHFAVMPMADAFHRMRKSMREVAEAVLLAHEMERSGVE